MAALAATDVAVSFDQRDVELLGRKKMVFLDLIFGDGAKTYPTGGVPLPAKEMMGFSKYIRAMQIINPDNGYGYSYDRANHKLKMLYADYDVAADGALIEVANTVAPAQAVLTAIVWGE